jgi:hypothetical protein
VFINGMITCLPVFTLFPIMSIIARRSGLSFIIWILIGCVLSLGALMDTSFGAFGPTVECSVNIKRPSQAQFSCSSLHPHRKAAEAPPTASLRPRLHWHAPSDLPCPLRYFHYPCNTTSWAGTWYTSSSLCSPDSLWCLRGAFPMRSGTMSTIDLTEIVGTKDAKRSIGHGVQEIYVRTVCLTDCILLENMDIVGEHWTAGSSFLVLGRSAASHRGKEEIFGLRRPLFPFSGMDAASVIWR